jgi:hypothetical protein
MSQSACRVVSTAYTVDCTDDTANFMNTISGLHLHLHPNPHCSVQRLTASTAQCAAHVTGRQAGSLSVDAADQLLDLDVMLSTQYL